MPTHQGERWLAKTLDSLVAQEDPGFECIVIDSSPDDATHRLAQAYAELLTLRIFRRQDLDHWRSKTNFGFTQAHAEHVCMLHQDDFWLPHRTRTVRAWIATPGVAVHLHPSYFVNHSGRRLGIWNCPLPPNGSPIPRDLLLARLLVQNFISVPSPIIRRDAFLEVGGLNEALWYTADWDLYLKLARVGSFAYHSEVLSCFRIHSDSLTISGSRNIEDFEEQMRSILNCHIAAVPESTRAAVMRKALVSIRVNSNLADGSLIGAVQAILSLRTREIYEYLRDSRLIERVIPRVRAGLARGL
jgi:hypothetical protein